MFTAEEGLEHATLGLGAAVLDFAVHRVPNDHADADDDDSTCTPGHGQRGRQAGLCAFLLTVLADREVPWVEGRTVLFERSWYNLGSLS